MGVIIGLILVFFFFSSLIKRDPARPEAGTCPPLKKRKKDWSIESKGSHSALLRVEQSLGHLPYLLFLFKYLSPLCHSFPRLLGHNRNGNVSFNVRLTTRSLPLFYELKQLFYPMGVKLIPEGHIMYYLLSPIALAHWIMSDGQSHQSGLFLCTHSFSIPDVVRLMNVLMVTRAGRRKASPARGAINLIALCEWIMVNTQ
jgi:hypothetical protein